MMKTEISPIKTKWKASKGSWPRYSHLVCLVILFLGLSSAIQGQTIRYSIPSWWFGITGAANVNFYDGTTDNVAPGVTLVTPFHRGMGVGSYAAPLAEYHPSWSRWGGMLQVGYDSRYGEFDQETEPCDCPSNLAVQLNYISVEPSVRFAPFMTGLHFYLGPRIAYNIEKSFLYERYSDPAEPGGANYYDEAGDISNVRPVIISGQVGVGYDIDFKRGEHRTQWMLTPYVAYHPYFGQNPRTTGDWQVSTVRGGLAVKFGRGKPLPPSETFETSFAEPSVPVYFTATAPAHINDTRRVNEVFPLRNYVYFDSGSTEIPSRYARLRMNQAKDFRGDQIEMPYTAEVLGRSHRQLVVYYNVLNILGERMVNQPGTKVRLVGHSEAGEADGLAMANSVKSYLEKVFGIESSRISVEGRKSNWTTPSRIKGEDEISLMRSGSRRVSIESDSPGLLMEYQTGAAALMKPVELRNVGAPPLESYVNFSNEGASQAFTSWRLEVTDEKGRTQYYGPYTRERVSMPGKTILGRNTEGDYHVVMIGETRNGQIVRKSTDMHLTLEAPVSEEDVVRYSVIYEFDEAKTPDMYVQYLNEVVAPKIPEGSRVLIHGYTDVIGGEEYNKTLSLQRATDVRQVLEKALTKAGKKNVTIEVFGFGEDPYMSQFENTYPEERSYNRSVLIDIVAGL
jgi:outer membrane protein OmpA-like peptidoglycan-associated protein